MIHVIGKGSISAKIVADSISAYGKRITTFELEYPRFIHSEFTTHRMISKNAASSRAIPVNKMIENIIANTAMPIHWGKNQPGMSAKEECDQMFNLSWGHSDETMYPLNTREDMWRESRSFAIYVAEAFSRAGYHKQIVNRLLEPYQFMKVVATATEWDNFFWLRDHEDAQPEIRELARVMLLAMNQSKPVILYETEWHMPYFENGYWKEHFSNNTLEEALMISSSCCAQTSYRKSDDSLEKAIIVYNKLVESKPVHASPFEHQAKPMKHISSANDAMNIAKWEAGVTHLDSSFRLWSANFCEWVQHRKLINNDDCKNYSGILK